MGATGTAEWHPGVRRSDVRCELAAGPDLLHTATTFIDSDMLCQLRHSGYLRCSSELVTGRCMQLDTQAFQVLDKTATV